MSSSTQVVRKPTIPDNTAQESRVDGVSRPILLHRSPILSPVHTSPHALPADDLYPFNRITVAFPWRGPTLVPWRSRRLIFICTGLRHLYSNDSFVFFLSLAEWALPILFPGSVGSLRRAPPRAAENCYIILRIIFSRAIFRAAGPVAHQRFWSSERRRVAAAASRRRRLAVEVADLRSESRKIRRIRVWTWSRNPFGQLENTVNVCVALSKFTFDFRCALNSSYTRHFDKPARDVLSPQPRERERSVSWELVESASLSPSAFFFVFVCCLFISHNTGEITEVKERVEWI